MALLERVQVRLAGEPDADKGESLRELCDLASVRICLRVREPTLPALLEPIAADVVVKLWRRWNYEGITSESVSESGGTLSTSFVEDVLAEYDDEFSAYVDQQKADSGRKKIRFL